MKFLVLLFLLGFATANIHQGQEEEERNLWQSIKDVFNDLQIKIKKEYMKFGEWATNMFKEGLEKGKNEIENIKILAKEFIKNAENVSKEVAHEAEEFFSKRKEELGALWDGVKKSVEEAKKRQKTNRHIPHRGGIRRGRGFRGG